jgi:hypothetical protein
MANVVIATAKVIVKLEDVGKQLMQVLMICIQIRPFLKG